MLARLKHLITINSNNNLTVYLFCKETKTLLPIELKVYHNKKDSDFTCPTLINTLSRAISGMEGTIEGIRICKPNGKCFYTYILIKHNHKLVEINIDVCDGIKLAELLKVPVYTKPELLIKEGIYVTRKKIEESLMAS